MWQSNNRTPKQQRKKISAAPQLEMRRVSAEIKQGGSFGRPAVIANARVVLSDFSPESVSMFSTHPFQENQEISLTIDLPKQFYCRGKVLWSTESASSGNVLSGGDKPFKYRVRIEFIFDSDEEKQQILSYCEDLARQKMLILSKRAA